MATRAAYDPVAAREYYLRTRKLKGRPQGNQKATFGRSGATKSINFSSPTAKRQAAANRQQAAQKAATEKRVRELKARLDELKLVLKRLVDEAKGRSGVEPPKENPKGKQPGAGSKTGKSEDKTASEKAKAAKAAQEKYDKEHPEAALLKDIESVRKRIEKAREKLDTSVQRARGKAAVSFVSKRPTG